MNHSVPSIPWEIDVISAHTSLRCLNELKNLFFFFNWSIVVLQCSASAVQQRESAIRIHIYPFSFFFFFFFGFISLLCHHRALSRFPCPVQQVLISNLYICVCVCVCQLLNCIRLLILHRLQPTELLCPWDSPGKNTAVVCHVMLQGISPIHESNLCLLHCRQILYHLSHQGRHFIHSSVYIVNPVVSIHPTNSFSPLGVPLGDSICVSILE